MHILSLHLTVVDVDDGGGDVGVSDADVGEPGMDAADIGVHLAEGDAVVHGDDDAEVGVVVDDVDLEMMIVAVCVLDGTDADVDPARVPALELGNEDEGKIVETYRKIVETYRRWVFNI